ncbi:caspase family protein [Chloroflexi bacterium TSY]|nr:caspase family protein [Chloroflexi bacterium TSY]
MSNGASFFSQGYALIVGVGNYRDNSLSVPVTAQDAEDLKQLFTASGYCAYPDHHVSVLTNENANKIRILTELEGLKDRIEKNVNATLFVFFSGHGWQDNDSYYFLPYETEFVTCDGNTQVKRETVLSNDEFLSKIRQIPAQRLVILFNTCFAGGVGTALSATIENLPEFAPVPLGLYDKLLEGSGLVIISSSQATEKSWIKGGAKHSLFVEHLLTGFRGEGVKTSQDTIRILDLFDHLSTAVPKDAETIGVSQVPVLKAYDVTENFPIGLFLGGQGSSPKLVKGKQTYNTAKIRRLSRSKFGVFGYFQSRLQGFWSHLFRFRLQKTTYFISENRPNLGVVHFRRTIRFTFLQREKMFIFSNLSHAQAENDLI